MPEWPAVARCSPMHAQGPWPCPTAVQVQYVRERALFKHVCEACRSIRCKTRAANGGGLVAPSKSHPCTERVLGGMSPPMRRRMRMYKYARFFLFLNRILLQLQLGRTGQGPCMRLRLLVHVTRRRWPMKATKCWRAWGERQWRIAWFFLVLLLCRWLFLVFGFCEDSASLRECVLAS